MSVKKYIALVLNYCYFFWSSNPENKTTHLWKQNIISNYTAFKHFLLRRQRPFSAVDPPPLDVSLQAKTNCTWQWWIPLPAALGGCIHPPSSLSLGTRGQTCHQPWAVPLCHQLCSCPTSAGQHRCGGKGDVFCWTLRENCLSSRRTKEEKKKSFCFLANNNTSFLVSGRSIEIGGAELGRRSALGGTALSAGPRGGGTWDKQEGVAGQQSRSRARGPAQREQDLPRASLYFVPVKVPRGFPWVPPTSGGGQLPSLPRTPYKTHRPTPAPIWIPISQLNAGQKGQKGGKTPEQGATDNKRAY